MNAFKVGILSLLSMAAVVVMSLKITSNQSGFGTYYSYKTIIRDASGIFPKTPIKVAGINAGKISKIELMGNSAHITFEVLDKVTITKDAKLRIKTVGFLGDKYLELYVGDSKERLEELSYIESVEGGGMETIVKDASEVLKDVKAITESLRDSLAPKGEEPPIKRILGGVDEMIQNTKQVTASLKRIFSGNEEKLNDMIANFEKFSNQLAYHVDRNEKESAINDIKVILDNAKKITSDLQIMMNNMKNGKGTMGKFLVEEEIADEVRQTLAGVNKIVSKVDNIRTELGVFTGVQSGHAGIETPAGGVTEASLRIFPSPERFYQLGITTTQLGPKQENIETEVSSTTGTEEKTITRRDKDTYTFNIQLGRKIDNWTFRGGLIESSGGLGVDYELDSLRSKFSFEVFDVREELGPNLRVGTEFQLWNVFYGQVRVEDLQNTDNIIGSVSAGLRFNDEDLKGLIGFFF